MAYREFTDDQGVVWTAWDTYPESSERVGLGAFQTGWLTFQSSEERRRLFPIPEGWAEAPDVALREWVGAAAGVISKGAATPRERVLPIGVTPAPPAAPAPGDLPRVNEDVRTLIRRSRETLDNLERAISAQGDSMAAGSGDRPTELERRRGDRRG